MVLQRVYLGVVFAVVDPCGNSGEPVLLALPCSNDLRYWLLQATGFTNRFSNFIVVKIFLPLL